LKRRYALAGLLAAISMLFSLAIVAHADLIYPPDESHGNILRARQGGNPLFWWYILPSGSPYTTYDIELMYFWVHVDGVKTSVPIKSTTIISLTVIEIELFGSFMRDGALADDTYIEVQMIDDEWYWADGPAPMWRRGG